MSIIECWLSIVDFYKDYNVNSPTSMSLCHMIIFWGGWFSILVSVLTAIRFIQEPTDAADCFVLILMTILTGIVSIFWVIILPVVLLSVILLVTVYWLSSMLLVPLRYANQFRLVRTRKPTAPKDI